MVDISGLSLREHRGLSSRCRGGEYRHAVLNGTAANLNAVLKVDAGENGARVYNIADIARADRIENLGAALAELAAHAVRMPCFLRNAAVPAVASILKPR